MSLLTKKPQLVDLAALCLGLERSEAELNSREVPELNAVYFWTPVRGGTALLIGEDESVLFAQSSVPYDVHLAAFKDGRRADLDAFERPGG